MKLKHFIYILIVLCVILLSCGCTESPKRTYDISTYADPINTNVVYARYNVEDVGYKNGFSIRHYIVPDCENGIVFFNHQSGISGTTNGVGLGIYGCRDCDVIKKYCPAYIGPCNLLNEKLEN